MTGTGEEMTSAISPLKRFRIRPSPTPRPAMRLGQGSCIGVFQFVRHLACHDAQRQPSIKALLPTPASPTTTGLFLRGGRECRSSGRFRGRGTVPGQPAVTGVCGHVFGVAGKQGVTASVSVPATLPSASGTTDSATPVSTVQSPVADGHG